MLQSAASAKNSAQPYRTILKHLAAKSTDGSTPAPVLLHCTAGKDRTGVICALILSLCGVPDEIVAHEYSLTTPGLKPRWDEIFRQLSKKPEFRHVSAGAVRMAGSK
jgi:protein tyrosine/serine phosphatase